MESINRIRASDGTANASVATVQNTRTALASTIIVDTVDGIPAEFMGSMGTPHTFTDPITSEVITVISEATAVDFSGHVDGANLEIDIIAPGYTDNGSEIGDIVIIRPTTQYADNIADVLDVSHDDDGTLKGSAIREGLGIGDESFAGWDALGVAPNTVTNNGNRSYNLVFNSNDLTDTVSAGMRLRLTRTVSAPTQCADLEASSSQYFSSASAGLAGMTFTDDFTIIIHVPALESYAAMRAVSRIGASSGWSLGLRSDGRVEIIGYNASYANFSSCLSYQSVPLGKAFDIVAQLDMSAFTATPTTSYIMIDGADVPAVVSRGGTNPTSLVQQGDLNIGAYNNASEFFDGKIAQVAIFNAKVTQATARTYLSQGFSGSETNLVSAYSLSNSLLDLNTTNNNDLTANGGALATAVDSPFGNHLGGTLEYAIITKTAFSTNTTLTVQVPEGCAIPTSGGVSAVAYSTQAVPYGFPRDKTRFYIVSTHKAGTSQAAAVNGTWYNLGSHKIIQPIGSWIPNYSITPFIVATTSGFLRVTLSTSTSTESDPEMTGNNIHNATTQIGNTITKQKPSSVTVSTATDYYLNLRQQSGSSVTIYDIESSPSIVWLELACF